MSDDEIKRVGRVVLRLLERAVTAFEQLAKAQAERARVEQKRLEDDLRYGRGR